MATFLDQLAELQKGYTAPEEQTITAVISDIKPTKDDRRVMLVTDKGNLFAFRNTFDGGVPVASKEFKAEITLRKNGEYINISRVKYSLEDTGKYSFVATQKLAVAL